MSVKPEKAKFEAVYKLRSWGREFTCPTHYVKIYFETQKEMEDWVDHNYALPDSNEFSKFYSVTDLEMNWVVYSNYLNNSPTVR